MDQESKKCLCAYYKETYQANFYIIIACSAIISILSFVAFIMYASPNLVFSFLIDLFPMLCYIPLICFTFRNQETVRQRLYRWRVIQCSYTFYMLIFSGIMIGVFSNYYNECYDGTVCREDEHYGDRTCCNIDNNECWDCSDYDEDDTVLIIVASVLSLVASLFSGFLIPQQYTVQKKLNLEFQSPQLIQHVPQNIQVSNPQQIYQQPGYSTQQAGYQNPAIQQGQPFQPAAYQQPTQQQGYLQPQPGGHQQQTNYGYQNNPNQPQNTGGQWPQQ